MDWGEDQPSRTWAGPSKPWMALFKRNGMNSLRWLGLVSSVQEYRRYRARGELARRPSSPCHLGRDWSGGRADVLSGRKHSDNQRPQIDLHRRSRVACRTEDPLDIGLAEVGAAHFNLDPTDNFVGIKNREVVWLVIAIDFDKLAAIGEPDVEKVAGQDAGAVKGEGTTGLGAGADCLPCSASSPAFRFQPAARSPLQGRRRHGWP